MRKERTYFVYMMNSSSRRAIYTGMCNNLERRVSQHKTHEHSGFSDDYNVTRLVYFETFKYVGNAIRREKQIKRWRRDKKVFLIESMNSDWRDLSLEWGKALGPSTRLQKTEAPSG